MFRRLLIVALAVSPSTATSAQVRQPGLPASETHSLGSDVPTAVLPPPDVEAYLREDAARENRPYRYGAVLPAELSFDEHGLWEETRDGAFVWRLRIVSPGAHTLGVVFGEYALPRGARLFLYNDGRTHLLGAYTQLNNKANGVLAVQPVEGEAVTIEYVQERGVTDVPRLSVREVIHDYRDVYAGIALSREGSSTSLLACTVDINCPEGAPYQVLKRAVMWGMADGVGCSASILNNTAEDGTPYMLHADHCGDFTNAVFLFNYEKPGCASGTAPQDQSVSGATLLSQSMFFDSRLYLLSETPPADYAPYYAGWSRTTAPDAPMVGISHPNGSPKKLSIDDADATECAQYWEVNWELGLLHLGSSGSPLFDGQGRVIGPACCTNNFDCGNQTAWYGRFDRFFNAGNLAPWLDPLGTGAQAIDGFDPCPPVELYCTAKTNSCGGTPRIAASGNASASSSSGFLLTADAAPTGKVGVVLYTSEGAQLPALPFQGGLLCIAAPIRRSVPVPARGGTAGSCDAQLDLDWNAFAAGVLGGNPAAFLRTVGQRVDLQWWGRDTVAHGSYLSDALQYRVCP